MRSGAGTRCEAARGRDAKRRGEPRHDDWPAQVHEPQRFPKLGGAAVDEENDSGHVGRVAVARPAREPTHDVEAALLRRGGHGLRPFDRIYRDPSMGFIEALRWELSGPFNRNYRGPSMGYIEALRWELSRPFNRNYRGPSMGHIEAPIEALQSDLSRSVDGQPRRASSVLGSDFKA